MVKKIILRIVSIVVIALILLAGGFIAFKRFSVVKTENKLAMVDRQLSFCQELVTAKYRYSDIITLKKSAGFSKSYSIIKYTGIIRAGIADFTDISYSVSLDGKTITLSLPKAEVLGNEIVNLGVFDEKQSVFVPISTQEIFDEKQSVFVPISTQEIFDEIEKAKAEAVEDMLAEGVLEDAREYASRIITQFMLALGFEDVRIK